MDKEVYHFVRAVGAVEPTQGDELYPVFREFFKRSNYFLLRDTLLIVKISRSDKPFWGVGRKYIEFLNRFDSYLLVLLTSKDRGWFFTKRDVNKKIRDKVWNLREEDDNYKINYNTVRYHENRFTSIEQFARRNELQTVKTAAASLNKKGANPI